MAVGAPAGRQSGGRALCRRPTRTACASTRGSNGCSTNNWRAPPTSSPLLGDLAVGVDPDGADAWVWRDVLAPGVRIGAPPDEFNLAGQDWGLPPFVPWRLRAVGLRAVRADGAGRAPPLPARCASTTSWGCSACSGSRRDCTAAEGTYVRYPGTDLLDIVALESARAGAEIVGEDLGTVEDDVRDQLAERAVLSYRVVWFETRTAGVVPGSRRSRRCRPTTCRRFRACGRAPTSRTSTRQGSNPTKPAWPRTARGCRS